MALLAVMCASLALVYDRAARADPTVKVNWIFAQRARDLDFIVLGSSRAYLTVDIPTMQRILGAQGVNLGLNGAAFPEQALVLDRFLGTNRSREVLLEVDPFGLDRRWLHDQLHAYLYVPYIDERLVASYLREYFGERADLWRYVPLFKYAEFNDRIGLKSVLRIMRDEPPEFDEWGSRLSLGLISESAIASIHDTAYAIDSERVLALERVLDIAAAHGARVTMFMAPQFARAAAAVRNRGMILARYRAVAERRGLTFMTFDQLDLASDPAEFRDADHLNRLGAMKFSRRLAEALRMEWAETPGRGSRP